MPLPFSFSTQGPSYSSEFAAVGGMSAVHEVVMQQPPGFVSTEPLLGTPGNSFMPPQMMELRPSAQPERVAAGPMMLPPAPSPNQRVISPPHSDVNRQLSLVDDTLTLPAPPRHMLTPGPVVQAVGRPTSSVATQVAPEWTSQLDQLRNDIFGIAMSVSAMSDRIDRLDHAPHAAAAGLATLRSEIQAWLESHLNAAVEHCMHSIMSRAAAQQAVPN